MIQVSSFGPRISEVEGLAVAACFLYSLVFPNDAARKRVFQEGFWCFWVFGLLEANKQARLKGIWHAAGVLDDHLMAELQREHLVPWLDLCAQ